MTDSRRIHRLPEADDFTAIAEAAGPDQAVIELSTIGGSGRKAFFDAVRSAVRLDPPVVGERSWDALEDSLWEGLFQRPERRIVIAWRDASDYAARSPEDYEVAISVLSSVGDLLADERATTGRPKEVEVYIR